MKGRLFFRITEAAEQLALSRSKVYQLIQAGRIRVVHIDGSARITPEELQRFADVSSGRQERD